MTAKCPLKAEAKRLGRKTYFTGISCLRGHIAERIVSCGACIICHRGYRRKSYYKNNQKDLMRRYARERRARDPVAERQRAVVVNLKCRYGITELDYHQMYTNQHGKCAICKLDIVSRLDTSRPLYLGRGAPANEIGRVDHCHKSGFIRGLLCSNCNLMLGKANDDERILLNAIRYLRNSRNRIDVKTDESRDDLRAERAAENAGPQSSSCCESQHWLN